MNETDSVLVLGGTGLVGGSVTRKLEDNGFIDITSIGSAQLDLMNQRDVFKFFTDNRFDYVFFAAAKVGGVMANMNDQYGFLYQNLIMECNVIEACRKFCVNKLMFIGSSCIYPAGIEEPIVPDDLLSGKFESTNTGYALAKVAGVMLARFASLQRNCNFISVMPCNLYGPGDNFDINSSHVLPALIRKFHAAKVEGKSEVVVWGSGRPKREFLYIDDFADAALFIMNFYDDPDLLNVGTGSDISIVDLSLLISDIVGFNGKIVFDTDKPDGVMRKVLDVSELSDMGWAPKYDLRRGITETYEWYCRTPYIRGI